LIENDKTRLYKKKWKRGKTHTLSRICTFDLVKIREKE
jgi:hypothetical protein